jgi:hypothetical protein
MMDELRTDYLDAYHQKEVSLKTETQDKNKKILQNFKVFLSCRPNKVSR